MIENWYSKDDECCECFFASYFVSDIKNISVSKLQFKLSYYIGLT